MADFFSRLLADPRKAIDAASITRVDELGNGYDDWNNLIAPKFEQPQQTWGETALGVATAPARLATALAGSLSPYGAEGWQIPPIVKEGANALTAVGDAYTQGMSEDEMRNRALGMASVMFAGGGPAMALEKSLAPRPVSVRGYHGTRSEFDKFNGPSVFASENPDAASEWAMVANREGGGPNVLPLDITASNPYYAKSLFPDQAERDRIVRADPDVVFYPPSTQHGTTFDTHSGRVFEARKPGTVRSATTGETLFSNASKEGAVPGIAGALEQKGARPEPSANALSSELSGTGFYPLSGGAETGTYLAFDDLPGNAPSPKQQQVRQMAAGHQGRMRSHPGQQAPEGLSSTMGGQELSSSGTPIGSFLDRSHYPRTGLNPIHEVHNWAKVRSMARKAINGEHVPGYLYDGSNGNGNLLAGTHRSSANELLDILGYGKRIKSANINDVLDEPEAYGLSARNADRLRQAAEDGDYRLIDEIWDQSRDTSLFSNSDSRPALLASALGQEQIDPERIKTAIRNRMRGDK